MAVPGITSSESEKVSAIDFPPIPGTGLMGRGYQNARRQFLTIAWICQ
jgi:hypothetical protein